MIQIIDYGAGNIRSVINALSQLGIGGKVISSAKELNTDCRTIFPGVGAAGSAMKELKRRGFITAIPKIEAPFLGICLGMQLLMDFSEENSTECLKIIGGKVLKFPKTVKIPQIGWNKVEQEDPEDLLFKDIPNQSYFYFVNSYYVDTGKSSIIGTTDYGTNFASVIRKQNFYGVQFHPEKSGEIGLKLLNNFCKLC
ncbi:MAG: imidazole glycerol phosphate synthase subunit HisH [Candidatus Gracilibacteria bacterium]|jgi:glutamine amidotransferase